MVSIGASPSRGRASAPSDPVTVMIADDEPALRLALTDLLANDERVALVGSASDADEAIGLVHRERPQVALVDVKMPGGGGPRAAREILRTSPDTRVIALSAFEDRPTVLEMLKAGAVGYLVKGTATDDIVDSIARVAGGGTSLSPGLVSGIIEELATQLRREEREREERLARRHEIERFVEGDGLSMVFQPIVDLRSRELVGLEALARFATVPIRPPNEWFAEAVAVELGVELELASIRRALVALPRLSGDAYLSVNCSSRAAASTRLLQALGDAAERVVVEITEHEPVDDYELLADTLTSLRARGTRIAIDDAGAGFASLRHILQLSPDILKMDMSLTRGIDVDRGKRALASALISFGEEMGTSIVAEGIETREQLEALHALGVRYGQGYLLATPGPLGDVLRDH